MISYISAETRLVCVNGNSVSPTLRPEDISEDDLSVPVCGLSRVMLVRATPGVSSVMLDKLERTPCNDFEFSSVLTVADAIKKIDKAACDLVVLTCDAADQQRFNGFDALKKSFPELPVIIFSDSDKSEVALSAIRRGVDDFIITANESLQSVKLRLQLCIERHRSKFAQSSISRMEKFVLRSVIEKAPLMFLRLDSACIVRDCNKNFAEVLLQPREQLRRRLIFDLLPDVSASEIQHLSQGDQLLRKRIKVLKDGEEAYWNFFGWPFYKTNSEERECIIVAIDVTRETQLNQFREEFLAAVAHDIKNPVAGQEKVLSALLNTSKEMPPEMVSSITTIRNSSLELLNFLNTLVETYRSDSGEYPAFGKGFSINAAITKQYDEWMCIAESSKLTVELDLAEPMPLLAMDPTATYRLVSNLIYNALQNAPSDTRILVKTYFDKNNVVLEVNNQGPPISESDICNLFQRFSRSMTGTVRANSSGLGLYLCKQMVERFGGTIFCISDANSGTTFVVKLPINKNR